ncbi:MAG: long-chain fatty acid--CoA ligase [archaeon]
MDTLQELVQSLEKKPGVALSWKDGQLSYAELYGKITAFSKGLHVLGLEPGDTIAVFSKNLPEWILVSLGINNAGMVDVPRGEDNSPEDLAYIIEHSESKLVIVDDESTLKKVTGKIGQDKIYSIKPIAGAKNIADIIAEGMNTEIPLPSVSPDQTASIIYTSGTTGNPKGVELTHRNFASNMDAVLARLAITSEDKNMSILPAWHTFERIAKYVFLAIGSESYYTTQRSLMKDLQTQKPTVMASVPRIWESVYSMILKNIREKSPEGSFMDKLFTRAVAYGNHKTPLNWAAYQLCNIFIFSKVRKQLGGNFRFAVSGGSGLPQHIDDFYRAAEIKILEGYGMTETSPVLSVRSFYADEKHSVGKPLENLDIKISEDGVLFVKGPSIMKGYFKNPEATKEVLSTDGWLCTGDLAHMNDQGCLVITGRAKDLIKLSNGEYVNPAGIELALKNSPYIDAVVVVGQDAKHLGALIVPNLDLLELYCKNQGIAFSRNPTAFKEYVLPHKTIKALFTAEIKKYNATAGFKNYEIINDYLLLPTPFTVGKELTASLKVKRRAVEQVYQREIQALLGK